MTNGDWQLVPNRRGIWRNGDGYQITRVVSRKGRRIDEQFVAWGAEVSGWRSRLRAVYAVGDRVPQPRKLIGVYPSMSRAMRACDEHQQEESDAA